MAVTRVEITGLYALTLFVHGGYKKKLVCLITKTIKEVSELLCNTWPIDSETEYSRN